MAHYLLDEPLTEDSPEAARIARIARDVERSTRTIPAPEDGFPGPFAAAIYGAWGSGKTSLLKALQVQFKKRGCVTVWFEPWRYENEEHLLLPLLVEFHASMHREIAADDVKQAALNTAKKLVGRVARGVLRSAGKLVERHTGLDPYEIGEEFLKQYGEQERDWSTSLSEVEEFRKDFRRLISLASRKSNDGRQLPVVVLIDDLDRCDSLQVRRLLESVKLFLHVPGVYFFLALDERQVLQAMATPYRDRFRDHPGGEAAADALGKQYLEKFFQLALDVSEAVS